jgi:hypothetical protein
MAIYGMSYIYATNKIFGTLNMNPTVNIKLPSTYVLRRKEVKRVLYFVPALMEVYYLLY